jgi:hypothetical protein
MHRIDLCEILVQRGDGIVLRALCESIMENILCGKKESVESRMFQLWALTRLHETAKKFCGDNLRRTVKSHVEMMLRLWISALQGYVNAYFSTTTPLFHTDLTDLVLVYLYDTRAQK